MVTLLKDCLLEIGRRDVEWFAVVGWDRRIGALFGSGGVCNCAEVLSGETAVRFERVVDDKFIRKMGKDARPKLASLRSKMWRYFVVFKPKASLEDSLCPGLQLCRAYGPVESEPTHAKSP